MILLKYEDTVDKGFVRGFCYKMILGYTLGMEGFPTQSSEQDGSLINVENNLVDHQKTAEYVSRVKAGEDFETMLAGSSVKMKEAVAIGLKEFPTNDLVGHPKTLEYINRAVAGEDVDSMLNGLPEKMKEAVLIGLSEIKAVEKPEQVQAKTANNEEILAEKEAKEKETQKKIEELRRKLGATPNPGQNIESKEEMISRMDQTEFAEWLSQNMTEEELKNVGMYQLLTTRPENRLAEIEDSLKGNDDDNKVLLNRRMRMLPDLKKWALESENVLRKYQKGVDGIVGVEGTGWQHYQINEDETPRERDRIKGYVSLEAEGLLEKFDSAVMSDIVETLQMRGYHGQVKFPSTGGGLFDRFDNIVVHGNNDQETNNALTIIKEVLAKHKINTVFEQTGRDGFDENGNKTSHTQILADKVSRTVRERLGLGTG